MESWRKVWRIGVAPTLSTKGLEALATALREDDAQLLQGQTTVPPPLACVQDWPCEGACAIGFAHWKADELTTVADVEACFAAACFDADQLLDEPAAVRFFLGWFDETPREEMRRDLLLEVELALQERSQLESK